MHVVLPNNFSALLVCRINPLSFVCGFGKGEIRSRSVATTAARRDEATQRNATFIGLNVTDSESA